MAQTSCNYDICSNFTATVFSADCPSLANSGFYDVDIGVLPSGTPMTEWIGFLSSADFVGNETFTVDFGNRTAGTYTLGFYYSASSDGATFTGETNFTVNYNGSTLLTETPGLPPHTWQYRTIPINHSGGNLSIEFASPTGGSSSDISYTHISDLSIISAGGPLCPTTPDVDGDGVADGGMDTDAADPCIPIQSAGYTGYNSANATWQAADCDMDGVLNSQELTDGTDPYDATDFIDADGDGVADTGVVPDSNPADPCVPAQSAGYTGYDPTNATWAAEDCDGDGTSNGQENTNGTDPYFSECNAGYAIPILMKN